MNLLPLSLESLPALCRARLMIKIAIAVACCGLCSSAPAVTPPPDGGYPGYTTGDGTDARFSLTTGEEITAIGVNALRYNTTGSANSAIGAAALYYGNG